MTNLLNMCAHGKSLREPCMACAKLDRIEERMRAEMADLRHQAARLRSMLKTVCRADTLEEVRAILGSPASEEPATTREG